MRCGGGANIIVIRRAVLPADDCAVTRQEDDVRRGASERAAAGSFGICVQWADVSK